MSLKELRPIRGSRKTKLVQEALHELAKRIGKGGKLPKVGELCKALNVAIATLDSAMSELEKRGVLERIHGHGIFVSSKIDQKAIGLVFGVDLFQTGSPVFEKIVHYARANAASEDERLRFYLDIPETRGGYPCHENLMEDMKSGILDGVFFVGACDSSTLDWMNAHSVPMVSMGLGASPTPSVQIDYSAIIEMGTKELASRGCQKIHLVPLVNERSLFDHHEHVFNCALRKLGMKSAPNLLLDVSPFQQSGNAVQMTSEEVGYHLGKKIFGGPGIAGTKKLEADGLVVLDDIVTRGLLIAAQRAGLAVGKTLLIATHANKGTLTLAPYEEVLCLLEVDPAVVVREALKMLSKLIDERTLGNELVWIRPQLRTGPLVRKRKLANARI